MFDKTTGHGNDGGAICSLSLLFFACAIFQETLTEMDVKNVNVKNKSTAIFHDLYSYRL